MGLAGHLILIFSVGITISVTVSLSNCLIQSESPCNPVASALPCSGLLELCCILHCLFYLPRLSWRTFSMLAILSSIRLYLSPPSSFIFSMVEVIPRIWRSNEFVIECGNVSIFRPWFFEYLSICSSVLFDNFSIWSSDLFCRVDDFPP